MDLRVRTRAYFLQNNISLTPLSMLLSPTFTTEKQRRLGSFEDEKVKRESYASTWRVVAGRFLA